MLDIQASSVALITIYGAGMPNIAHVKNKLKTLAPQVKQFQMAPSVSVNFISLVTSCVLIHGEGVLNSLPHVLYMGVSYSC